MESIQLDRDPSADLAELAERDAAAVLDAWWPGECYPWCDCRAPFGRRLPALTPGPERVDDRVAPAVRFADDAWLARLAVVPVARPAEVPVALGWRGTCNVWDDVVGLGAVLRSWEDRFGALLVRMDRATIRLSVAAPPWTVDACLRVAAEHFAFCPDVDGEDPRPLRAYAGTLRGAATWRFWWD